MKNSDLCLDSKKHWMRMVKEMKGLSKEEENGIFNNVVYDEPYNAMLVRLIKSKEILGECWNVCDCTLCIKFHDADCDGCPLDMIGEGCLNKNSAWKSVNDSTSKKEWLNNAENRMIPAIERAYQYCLAIER